MSEVKRYNATELRFSTKASGSFVAGAAFDELRQQLADISHERDLLRKTLPNSTLELVATKLRLKASEARNTEALALLQYAYDHSELLPNEREVDAFLIAQSAPATVKCEKCYGEGKTLIFTVCGPVHKSCDCAPATDEQGAGS